MHVTLPLSRPAIMAGSALVVLPMFGDYYTNDLISASPKTNMLGNEINLFIQGGTQQPAGSVAGDHLDADPRGRDDVLPDPIGARLAKAGASATTSEPTTTAAPARRSRGAVAPDGRAPG